MKGGDKSGAPAGEFSGITPQYSSVFTFSVPGPARLRSAH